MTSARTRLAPRIRAAAVAAAGLALIAAGAGCAPHQRVEIGNTFKGETVPPTFTSPVCLRVERDDQIVTFLVRPSTGENDAKAALVNSEVALDLEYGTAFASGMKPVVKGVRTNAAASGTNIAMRVMRGINAQEFYYIHSSNSAAPTVVHVRKRSTNAGSLDIGVGDSCVYRYDTDELKVIHKGTPIADIPPEVLALQAEAKAVFGP